MLAVSIYCLCRSKMSIRINCVRVEVSFIPVSGFAKIFFLHDGFLSIYL